jgi:hypothetical protein
MQIQRMRIRPHHATSCWRLLATLAFLLLAWSHPAMAQPNTGMADPDAVIRGFDKFMAGGGGGDFLVLSLSNLRGLSSEFRNAGGRVRINPATGVVTSNVTGLASGQYDRWLIDNRPSRGYSTFADPGDLFFGRFLDECKMRDEN